MKTTNKKLIGGLLVGMLVATIGATFATGQTDGTSDDTIPQIPFGGRHKMNMFGPFASDLTDEQQTELEELTTTLRDQNATHEEIQTTIQEKLDEYGILDTQLDNQITQTEQQLTLLNRQKELRDEGYSWDEIKDIIEEEFDIQNNTGVFHGMTKGHRVERRPCKGSYGFMRPGEESDQ